MVVSTSSVLARKASESELEKWLDWKGDNFRQQFKWIILHTQKHSQRHFLVKRKVFGVRKWDFKFLPMSIICGREWEMTKSFLRQREEELMRWNSSECWKLVEMKNVEMCLENAFNIHNKNAHKVLGSLFLVEI